MPNIFPYPNYQFGYPSTIEGINSSFAQKLKQRYSIEFVPPKYTEHYVLAPEEHPNGGPMFNWSKTASVDMIDPADIVKNLPVQDFIFTWDPKLKITDYKNNIMRMYLNPSNQDLLPHIRRHEYKHMVNHSIPYNLTHIYATKRYNNMRDRQFFRTPNDPEHLQILTKDVGKWLDSPMKQLPLPFMGKIKYNDTRREIMGRLTRDLDNKLDRHENEENLYYTNVPLDDDWLSIYGWFIPDM